MSTHVYQPARDNLPAPASVFIGRRHETAEVLRLLSVSRLLTLTGPGGCGKTRLSLHAASEVRSEYPDGVWFVELAPLSDPSLLPQAVASAIGVREGAERSGSQPTLMNAIIAFLQTRSLLLLLDNCEHMIHSSAVLTTALLEACPKLRLMATSREVLRVPGETVWSVPPLSLPEPQPWRSPEREPQALSAYQQAEAFQLFVARASAASASFQLDAGNAPWIADICRRLDGLPLAIELAAARTRAFSARQIAERLDDRFNLLRQGPRTAAPRHQTLDAALDWSYGLLPENEQMVLRRLSIFAGGWTLEAAEAVCAQPEAAGYPAEVMYTLANLVDKSLVVVEQQAGESRYHLLETIRSYASQKLEAAGETSAAQDRRLDYFIEWAEIGSAGLASPEQPLWLARYIAEHENLRAALEWSHTTEDKALAGLSLAGYCGLFWRLNGFFNEGRTRLAAALDSPGAQGVTQARVHALLWAAHLAYMQSDFSSTHSLVQEGLVMGQALGRGARESVARALGLLGELGTEVGDYAGVQAYFEEALGIFRELDDKLGIADMLLQLAWAAMRAGDTAQGEALFSQSLPLLREMGVPDRLGLCLSGMGELALRQGQYERATRLLEESLPYRRELDDKWGIAATLGSLGWAAMLQRDFNRMRTLLRESITLRMEIGERGGLAWCLEKLAEGMILGSQNLPARRRRQEYLRAARIFGAAGALRRSVHAMIDPADQQAYDQLLADLKEGLGDEAYAAEWTAGSVLPVLEAVHLAGSAADRIIKTGELSDAQAARAQFGGLSSREREVAAWIAQGKTNQEIAALMVVGTRTVETYVTRILNKLGFTSRVQIAAWTMEAGLRLSDQKKT